MKAKRSFRVASAALGLFASLLVVEIGLRVFHHFKGTYVRDDAEWLKSDASRMVASADPELAFENRPGLVRYGEPTVESHGLLALRDVSPTKPAGTLRLAVVGDSISAASYLAIADRFTTLLEPRLSKDLGRPVEVLNFSVEGYDTLQEARVLETKVPAFDVDAVLLVYCLNDPATSYLPLRAFVGAKPPACFTWALARRALGVDRAKLLVPLLGPSGPLADHWRRMYDPRGDGWADVECGLDRIAAWTRATRIPLGVEIAPLVQIDDPDGRTTEAFRRQVADALTARSLPFLDLQTTCTAAGVERMRLEPTDVYHFGAAGHVVLAEATAPFVEKLLRK